MDENYLEAFPRCEEILSQNENKVDYIEVVSNNPMNEKIQTLELHTMKQFLVKQGVQFANLSYGYGIY